NTAIATTTTNSQGFWYISSFTCTHANDELFLVASGGNPGLAPGTNNSAAVLTNAIGPCNSLPTGNININEVTTVATEFALAGLSTDHLHVGTSSTNIVGLTNAFATVNNLVS